MPETPHRSPPRHSRPTLIHRRSTGRGRSRRIDRRSVRRALVGAAAIGGLVAVLLVAPGGSADRPSGGTAATAARLPADPPVAAWPVASLRLTQGAPIPVPASFLGLSTEYWSLPHYASQSRLFAKAIDLLRLPAGPFTLRIGGESADLSWWNPRPRPAPGWSYALTPSWVSDLAGLTAEANLKVILDLNVADRNPVREAGFAKAVVTRMPPGSVQALEIGNEPDLYPRMTTIGLYTGTHARVAHYFAWAQRYAPDRYISQFDAYAAALDQVGLHLPLGGPELSDPTQTQWLPGLIAAERGRLTVVTAHRYPLNACDAPSEPGYPTLSRLLSNHATAGLAASVKPAVRVAHRAGLQFGLTEFNSVTCGGTADVSGTFANALWAPDALFSLMQVGVDSVDLHIRARAYNPPFFVTGHGLRTRPIMFGLILFQRMLGHGSELVPAALQTTRSTSLRAWVVRGGGTERVLLINKGSHGANVRLPLGTGTVERLLGGEPQARTNTTLAGQSLTPGGRWHGRLTQERVFPTRGGGEVAVPGYSAALVTLPLGSAAHG